MVFYSQFKGLLLKSCAQLSKIETNLKTEGVPVTYISHHPYKNPILLPQPVFYLLG